MGSVDTEQPVPVRPRAGTAAARLDAEQVVQQRYHEVVVQVAPLAVADQQRHDRQPPGPLAAEDLDLRVAAPAAQGATPHALLPGLDQVRPDRLLEAENEPGPDRFDDGRGPALLARDRVIQI